MSKMSKVVKTQKTKNYHFKQVLNFMGGTSYLVDPVQTLRLVAASSIMGEPSFYRGSLYNRKYSSAKCIAKYNVLPGYCEDKTTDEIFTEVIDNALDFNFDATLKFAIELRATYNMRLNPQVIMVRAAIHPKRTEWSKKHPGMFKKINDKVMQRADEPMTQLAYFAYINNGSYNNFPSILKRSIADNLSNLSAYKINKYKNHEIGMINAVRIVHATSEPINELMRTGTVSVREEKQTWEQKRSAGMSWKRIYETTDMGHMAMLRNIRGIFSEITDEYFCKSFIKKLKNGVLEGKQFPFRYYSAYNSVKEEADILPNIKRLLLDGIADCIDISIDNMPKLKGSTLCLSDNSGSAYGTYTSEYGTTQVATIDNLSSIIACKCSEDSGDVVIFGNTYKVFPITKRTEILELTKTMSSSENKEYIGLDTEGGIWEYLNYITKNKIHYDNIFIYSDMQAGTGGLYGTQEQREKYKKQGFGYGTKYIDVYQMIIQYRKIVNPKVNVYSVQTAGYGNTVIPQMSYRCAILTGWTGKEAAFADMYSKQWDSIEYRNNLRKNKYKNNNK